MFLLIANLDQQRQTSLDSAGAHGDDRLLVNDQASCLLCADSGLATPPLGAHGDNSKATMVAFGGVRADA